MSPLLWNDDPKPPEDEPNDGALLFVILTLTMVAVVVIVQLVKA